MKTNPAVDSARVSLLLNELRLPAIKVMWPLFADQADKEGWPAARFLAAITEHEMAERDRRRIERHLAEARLLPGKTLDAFEFEAVPMISKAQVMAITAGDSWLEKGANLLLFGPPGGGKTQPGPPPGSRSTARASASAQAATSRGREPGFLARAVRNASSTSGGTPGRRVETRGGGFLTTSTKTLSRSVSTVTPRPTRAW